MLSGRKDHVLRGSVKRKLGHILVIRTVLEFEGDKNDSLDRSGCTPSCSQALGVDV